jgi:hypothetical protein
MDKNVEILQEILSSLYKGIGQESVFRKQKKNEALDKFLSKLYKRYGQQTIGKDFLWSFLTYNMEALHGRKTQFGSMVMLSWLLSEKSMERWDERKTENSDYFGSKFLDDHNVQKPSDFDRVDLEDLEEVERGRFFNTEVGFLSCQSLASYNEYSEFCSKCKFKIECNGTKQPTNNRP